MNEINLKELKKAFGTFITGVTVVTTKNQNYTHASHEETTNKENKNQYFSNIGFTANSFTSVSLDPPLLSVCLAKSMSCCEIFEDCSHFAINILAETQEDVSNLFASYEGDRFSKVDWKPDANGSPLIGGVTTSFSCSNFQQIDAGDHMILIGEVTDFETTGDEGLGYSNKGYFRIGRESS